ncbi:MAG: biotin--[acetyl-CoA-carboxylase] ligase [Coleofasciculaceae cyanobacterium]
MGFNQQQFTAALLSVKEQLAQQNQLSITNFVQEIPIQIFETLPSTNQTLWQLINQGATTPTLVIAERQTAGRGQWGRFWQSEPGGLYLSLALAPHLSASDCALLTMCSAWGIATALRSYNLPVLLKWPNDLLLAGRKLGGILTETRVQHGQINKAVVGVGINWSNPTPDSGINLQSFYGNLAFKFPSLLQEGRETLAVKGIAKERSKEDFLPKLESTHNRQELLNPTITSLESLAAVVVQGLLSGYQSWLEKGVERLLASYLELLDSLGRHILVDGQQGIITGVTATGELKVSLLSTAVVESDGLPGQELREVYIKPGTKDLSINPS